MRRSKNLLTFQRLLIGYATEVRIDSNGRILLPQLLRDYAFLDKKIVLIGQGKKIEIWNEDKWKASRDGWLKKGLLEGAQLPDELSDISL